MSRRLSPAPPINIQIVLYKAEAKADKPPEPPPPQNLNITNGCRTRDIEAGKNGEAQYSRTLRKCFPAQGERRLRSE